jgi:hypothetical protein
VSLFNQANGLENICNIIKPSNFSLESLIVDLLIVCDLASSFFKRDYLFPTNKQVNKLLAEVAE